MVISILLFYSNPNQVFAEIPFFTEESGDYLLIGNGPISVADAVNTNNFEFGATFEFTLPISHENKISELPELASK